MIYAPMHPSAGDIFPHNYSEGRWILCTGQSALVTVHQKTAERHQIAKAAKLQRTITLELRSSYGQAFLFHNAAAG